MRLHLIIFISIASLTLTCASRKNVADGSSIDTQEARTFSDELVDDIINDRRESISAKVDASFQKAGPQYLKSSIDNMNPSTKKMIVLEPQKLALNWARSGE